MGRGTEKGIWSLWAHGQWEVWVKKHLVNSHPGNLTKSVPGGSREGKLKSIIYGNRERNSNRNLEAGAESGYSATFFICSGPPLPG